MVAQGKELPEEAYYTRKGLDQYGLAGMMAQFERQFRGYLEGVQRRLQSILLVAISTGKITGEEIDVLADARRRIGEFGYPYAAQIGNIEATWAAAETLRGQYDYAVGIATKGLWLSYIFDLAGWNVTNILTRRSGNSSLRKIAPIEVIVELAGKRVLLLENDIMTGATLEATGGFLRTVMKCETVDALLLFDYTILERHEWKLARKVIDRSRVRGVVSVPNIHRDEEGKFRASESREIRIIDPPEKVPWIREIKTVRPFRSLRCDVPDVARLREVERRLAVR